MSYSAFLTWFFAMVWRFLTPESNFAIELIFKRRSAVPVSDQDRFTLDDVEQ